MTRIVLIKWATHKWSGRPPLSRPTQVFRWRAMLG